MHLLFMLCTTQATCTEAQQQQQEEEAAKNMLENQVDFVGIFDSPIVV